MHWLAIAFARSHADSEAGYFFDRARLMGSQKIQLGHIARTGLYAVQFEGAHDERCGMGDFPLFGHRMQTFVPHSPPFVLLHASRLTR